MNATILALSSSGFSALTNLFFRKCSSANSNTERYLFYYYLVSFIGSFFLQAEIQQIRWHSFLFTAGCVAGVLNVIMMLITARALQYIPSGITFTFQNAGSVFPNLVLFLILGPAFGFLVTYNQIVGMILILFGLFLGIFPIHSSKASPTVWLKYAIGCCLIQTAILSIFQARLLLLDMHGNRDAQFMMGFFGTALVFQAILLLCQKVASYRRVGSTAEGAVLLTSPSTHSNESKDVLYGALSGVTNVAGTYLLLRATDYALPLQKGLVFPLFTVSIMILCNLWGYLLYKEKPKFFSLFLCSLGVFVAAL